MPTEIPAPSAADMSREAEADYELMQSFHCSITGIAWLIRAVHAERLAATLTAEIARLQSRVEELERLRERVAMLEPLVSGFFTWGCDFDGLFSDDFSRQITDYVARNVKYHERYADALAADRTTPEEK